MITNPRPSPELPLTLPPNLDFLLGLSPAAMTLGLANILALLDRLGNPHEHVRTAVIAGTNGKGSVTAMLANILTAQGLRTGRFISPHVYSVNERVSIDATPISLDVMEAAAVRIAPLHEEIQFSYFEAITAIAFLVFAEANVDVAVMETGLGGRFDATNVGTPEVTVITSISLDHRRILGDTEAEILREKLGITRPGVPLLLGDLHNDLCETVIERGQREKFPVRLWTDLGETEMIINEPNRTVLRASTDVADYGEIELPFPGSHQMVNAMLAIGAAEIMAQPLRDVAGAVKSTYLPGRFEAFDHDGRTFYMDVAHNDAALTSSCRLLSAHRKKQQLAMVFGLMRRKELFEFPETLLRTVSRLYLVKPASETADNAMSPQELYATYFANVVPDHGVDIILCSVSSPEDWRRLLDSVSAQAAPGDGILVAGSHRIVEQAGRVLMREAPSCT